MKIFFSILFLFSLMMNIVVISLSLIEYRHIRPAIRKIAREYINVRKTDQSKIPSDLSRFIRSQKFQTQSEKLDFVRDWVHQNSVHKPDKKYSEYSDNFERMFQIMWRHHQKEGEICHSTCSTRAALLAMLLKALEIPSREVKLYSDEEHWLKSHTILEVWNDETKSWEIQDPHFNVTYFDTRLERRVGAVFLLMDLQNVVPVSSDKKGWGVVVDQDHQEYFDAIEYPDPPNEDGLKNSVFLVNPKRFDLSKRFLQNGFFFKKNEKVTFSEYIARRHNKGILLEV